MLELWELQVLQGLAEKQRKLVVDEIKPLYDMLEHFQECVRKFGEKGWLKRAFMTSESHLKTLVTLDKKIQACTSTHLHVHM